MKISNPNIVYIKEELAQLDAKSIRALREGNAERIADIEAQAGALRAKLALEPVEIEITPFPV